MSTGFNFSSGPKLPTATAAPTSSLFSTTPIKTSFGSTSTPAIASPLTGFGTASTSVPFKLGGLSAAPVAAAIPSTITISTLATPTTNPTLGAAANPTLGSTTSSTLTFKILEDYVNKWMNELDSQEKDFLSQATQLNALDKLMVENGDKIVDLSGEVDRLNNEQDQLEQELNFLYSQQTDLEGSIKKLEDGIEQMPAIPQQHCDTSRIEMYKLLIEVDNQLRSQSGDLRDVIKRLNCTNVNLNDPIMQINKILNAHMDSLNWIEENTGLIQNQAEKLTKTMDERLRETESSAKYSFLS